MKFRDRLYELRFKLRHLFTKKGQIAEHSDYVFEQYPHVTHEESLAENLDIPEELKAKGDHGDHMAGFATKAEFDEYVKTELPGSHKGHIGKWLHWTPLMAVDRRDKEVK